MDKKLARKWVDALRSGKYKQGKAALFSDGKYCCLGVLAKVVAPELELDSYGNGFASLTGLPAYHKVGLSSPTGQFKGCRQGISLATFNDTGAPRDDLGFYTLSLNFDEIADVIQIEYIEGL